MPRLLLVSLAALLLTFAAACGDDDTGDSSSGAGHEAAQQETGSESGDTGPLPGVEAEAEPNGEAGSDAGAVELPEFPIPAAPGATRANPAAADQLQLEYAEADFDEVVAFYDEWTEGDDDSSYERFEGADGSVGWRNERAQGDGFRAISVSLFDTDAGTGRVTVAVLLAN